MKRTKGIIMRTSAKYTVIFTDQGDFLEIPTPKDPPKLGQTIEVIVKPRRIPSLPDSWLKYSTAAVLLLVLSLTAFYFFLIPNIAVASVSLDINHSVELLVNNRGQVIKARDVNGASGILEGISLQGLDVYQTVNLIVENAHNQGMFSETQNLVLASVVSINRWGEQMIDTEVLRNSIRDDMILMNLSGSVVVSQTTQAIHGEAQQQGMTVNGYLIYDRCEEHGIAIQPASLRSNVQKALIDANVSVASLFPEESLEVSPEKGQDNAMEQHQSPGGHEEMNSEHWQESSHEEHSQEKEADVNSPFNDPQHSEEHSEGGHTESGHMEAH